MTKRNVSLVALAIILAACETTTAPGPKTAISLDFCSAVVPNWFAVQNEGEDWQVLTPNAEGTFNFDATGKVSIAFVRLRGPDAHLPSEITTEIFNITADELAPISGVACDVPAGTNQLSGILAGLTGQQVARLSMAGNLALVQANQPSYAFSAVPSGPHDLLASRFSTVFSSPPDRIIVRRDVDLPTNATIPTLDFATEGQALASSTLTVANLGADFATVGTDVRTANGTSHALAALSLSGSNLVAYYSLPAALTRSTDLHTQSVVASGAAGVRIVTQFYKTPINKTITMSPVLNTPTVNTVATSPYVRPRAFLTSQSEYDTAVEVDFTQFVNQVSRVVYVVTTRGFSGGTPGTWEAIVPDLSSTTYESNWGLQAGSEFNWIAHGYKGNFGDLLPLTEPVEGLVLTSATRSGTVSAP